MPFSERGGDHKTDEINFGGRGGWRPFVPALKKGKDFLSLGDEETGRIARFCTSEKAVQCPAQIVMGKTGQTASSKGGEEIKRFQHTLLLQFNCKNQHHPRQARRGGVNVCSKLLQRT